MLDDISVVKMDISPDCPDVCRDTKLCPGCRLLLLKMILHAHLRNDRIYCDTFVVRCWPMQPGGRVKVRVCATIKLD